MCLGLRAGFQGTAGLRHAAHREANGIYLVTLDDGWQNNYGDWQLDPKKFPHGDADIKAMVERIHQEGFKAQLWWSPLSAVPDSKLLTQ